MTKICSILNLNVYVCFHVYRKIRLKLGKLIFKGRPHNIYCTSQSFESCVRLHRCYSTSNRTEAVNCIHTCPRDVRKQTVGKEPRLARGPRRDTCTENKIIKMWLRMVDSVVSDDLRCECGVMIAKQRHELFWAQVTPRRAARSLCIPDRNSVFELATHLRILKENNTG